MFSRLQTASLNLSEILGGGATFEIPNFQRQYSWDMEHAIALLEDLLEASGALDREEAHPDYFLGSILLLDPAQGAEGVEATTSNGARDILNGGLPKAIVDGQQRILTLTTLVSVLRDLNENPESELATSLNNLLWLIPNGSASSDGRPRLAVSSPLASFLQDFVLNKGACGELPPEPEEIAVDEASILEVRERFLHELKDLTQLQRDRLSDYLCKQCHFLVACTQDRARAHVIFKRMNERGKSLESYDLLKADIFGLVPMQEGSFVDVSWRQSQERLGPDFNNLFSHLRVIHGTSRGRALVAIRAIMNKVGGASTFVTKELAPYAEIYEQIRLGRSDQGELPENVRALLVSLGRLNGDEWMPATLLALKPGAYSPEEALEVVGSIERYAYLTRLQMLVVHRRKRRFADITQAVRDGTVLTAADDIFPLSREESRTIFFNLREIYARSQKSCKAVLMRLNDHAAGRTLATDPGHYSVEHVLPRRTKPSGQWRKAFPDAEERTVLTHSLGNLGLVTEKLNQKLGNREFSEKREILAAADERHELDPITRDILEPTTWNSDTIRAREARMLQALCEIWKISPKN